MRISDLQVKDVVSMLDGKNLGRIIDIEMDDKGQILNFVVEKKSWFRFFRKDTGVSVSFSQIKKIGEDVILVEISS